MSFITDCLNAQETHGGRAWRVRWEGRQRRPQDRLSCSMAQPAYETQPSDLVLRHVADCAGLGADLAVRRLGDGPHESRSVPWLQPQAMRHLKQEWGGQSTDLRADEDDVHWSGRDLLSRRR